MQDELEHYAIVADLGGTFARFSRVDLKRLVLDKIEVVPCSEYENLIDALHAYRAKHSLEAIQRMALGVACPVTGDRVCFTNNSWHFSIRELKQQLQLSELNVINDFSAIATCLAFLMPHDVEQIGGGSCSAHQPKVVLGAGTGLGVAYSIPRATGYSAFGNVGGHASWGATDEQEWFIFQQLQQQYGHVSYERLLSGHGLENIYHVLATRVHHFPNFLSAADLVTAALEQKNSLVDQTIQQFFKILGQYAGNLALIVGALGGVYIGGGIVPRLLPLIHRSPFRASFEDKGRFHDFNIKIPTFVIKMAHPGLLGAAVSLGYSLEGVTDVVS